jgi:hypothetical protein
MAYLISRIPSREFSSFLRAKAASPLPASTTTLARSLLNADLQAPSHYKVFVG